MRKIIVTIYRRFVIILFYIFRLIPVKKNKIVATTFKGMKYGDNSKFIVEELKKIKPDVEIIWLKDGRYNYETPGYVKTAEIRGSYIAKAYHYATSKVWVNTHRVEKYVRKRKNQYFIETWHGGLGIKKIELDMENFLLNDFLLKEIENTNNLADVFVSNSEHLSNVYRNAFGYEGKIWKCGYPKNDIFFEDNSEIIKSVRTFYNLTDEHFLLYAPTFRDAYQTNPDFSVYDIDFDELQKSLETKFGGKWKVFVRWHPFLVKYIDKDDIFNENVIDATTYPDMQELILACDAFISDYSSGIFDAALRGVPCFTFATDFEAYAGDRGVYYTMDQLPFPWAKSNKELKENVLNFDSDKYQRDWKAFVDKTGLYETGHAGKDIANLIKDIMEK